MADSLPFGRRGGSGGRAPRPDARLLLDHHRRLYTSAGTRANWSIPLLIGRATARRLLAQPPSPPSSVALPRGETAIVELDERHYSWGYSRPVVTLDVAWNLAFVLVTVVVLLCAMRERPATPVRAWVLGYALQCLVHVGLVWFEYKRRVRIRERRDRLLAEAEDDDEADAERRSYKKLESLNAMFSLFWWMLGFYYIVVGGQALMQDAPHLYWLTIVFLAFDVFFAIFCIMLACILGMILCCCLPHVIEYLQAVAGQEGASDAEISNLPKFRFRQANKLDRLDLENERQIAITIDERDSVINLALPPEDSECCICLVEYEDGAELHSLPCSHHFHSDCVAKWLKISARCPLCKYNILDDEYA